MAFLSYISSFLVFLLRMFVTLLYAAGLVMGYLLQSFSVYVVYSLHLTITIY